MKIKKILAGIAGIGLIVLLLTFVNSFTGNPLSKFLAGRAAQQYIDENYSSLNLRIDGCGYNFKEGEYVVHVQSPTSVDTAFAVFSDSFGNVQGDNYEYEVANNFTTWRRLDEEMRLLAPIIIAEKLNYDVEHAFINFVEEKEGNDFMMKLERDMKLDIYNPPLPLKAEVTVYSDDVSYAEIAKVAKSLESAFNEQNIPISMYGVRIIPMVDKPKGKNGGASWVNSISISDFPAEMMEQKDLPLVMEKFEADRVAEYDAKYKK